MVILPLPTTTFLLKFKTMVPSFITFVALSAGVEEDKVGEVSKAFAVGVPLELIISLYVESIWVAFLNIPFQLDILLVSQLKISWLNAVAKANI